MKTRIAVYTLALVFAASGIAKLLSLPFEVEAFARWGYPPYFMYLTGVLEVAGAIGLLVRRVSALAALCLAGLMLGAIATHLVHREWAMLVLASGIAALAAWRGWSGRGEIRSLPGRRSGR
ncbi:DoxX family protein [Arenimonas sp.]|uniref:DoxX family protein n=1 Tax=Arenimonas sp. TaxID=1872635 RepID=UPI0025C2D3CB|nr:DoxX family protein [Arenimonas sp.]